MLKRIINSQKRQILIASTSLFIFSFIIRSIKANYFPLWHDEIITVSASISFAKALEYARGDVLPPFLYTVNALINLLSHGNIYFQKLPMIFLGALSIVLFYRILVYLKLKQPFLISLLPLTSFILVFYAQDLRPYNYLIFFSLLTFLYIFKLALDEKIQIYETLLLALSFALFPFIHYLSLLHILALDLTALILIFLLTRGKWTKILNLFLVNLFSLIILIPWADNFARNFTENKTISGEVHRLDFEIIKNLLYKFSGGAELWTIFVSILFFASLVLFVARFAKIKEWGIKEKFWLFVVLYLLIYLIGIAQFSSSRFIFWRYFLHLIWPFFFILAYGYSAIFESINKKIIALIIFNILFSPFLISNLINTTAYFLAPNRFSDWHSLATFSEKIMNQEGGKKILMENLANNEDLKFYLQDKSIEVENMASAWKLSEEIKNKGAENLIYIQLDDRNNEIGREAQKNFDREKVFWKSPYLDFLEKRKINPYWNYPVQYGKYINPIVFY